MERNGFRKIFFSVLAVAGIVKTGFCSIPAMEDLSLSSSASQEAVQTQDDKVLAQKRSMAAVQASLLSRIADVDSQISRIDAELAVMDAEKARAILLAERSKLFRQRREYKQLLLRYTDEQISMTNSLETPRSASSSSDGGGWTDGKVEESILNPNWNRNSGKDQKGSSSYRVKDEKTLRDVAEKLSKSIYGSFNEQVHIDLLTQNMGAVSLDPMNLVPGEMIMIPYKLAMLAMMGMQEKSLITITFEILKDVKDTAVRDQVMGYAVYAGENEESKKAFMELLVAIKLYGTDSSEFRQKLEEFHNKSEKSASDHSRTVDLTSSVVSDYKISGDFKDKVVAVSNVSASMSGWPSDVQDKVKKAAWEFTKLKNLAKTKGKDSSEAKKQFLVFKTAVEEAYSAVEKYKISGKTVADSSEYMVSNDPTGEKSRGVASVELSRKVRELNGQILTLIRSVEKTIRDGGWAKDQSNGLWESTGRYFFDGPQKVSTEKLSRLTSLNTDSSQGGQILGGMRVLYGKMHTSGLDLYKDPNFSLLRQRMISLIGMSALIEDIQPRLMGTTDGKFRRKTATEALQSLGIDPDKKDVDFYDLGGGAKEQFRKLFTEGDIQVRADGLRVQWIGFIAKLSSLSANETDQERFSQTLEETRKFWGEIHSELDRSWLATGSWGFAGAATGTLAAFAIANSWNPAGWVTALVIGVPAAVGVIAGNSTDHKNQVEKIRQYARLKMTTDMARASLDGSEVRAVEGMLFMDDVVMGYVE